MEECSGTGLPRFRWESEDLPEAWRSFKQHAEFMFGGPLKKKSEEEKCSYLMLWVGDKGRDLYKTWNLTEEEKKELESYYVKFEEYVEPKANVVFTRYKFNIRVQGTDESVEEFVTALKLLAKPCRYKDEDEMIRDRIVFGCRSEKVREDLIREGSNLTLQKAIDIARTQELSKAQLKSMSVAEASCNTVKSEVKQQSYKGNTQAQGKPYKVKHSQHTGSSANGCQRCGSRHPYGKCPAFGKTCVTCGKAGRFSRMYHKRMNAIDAVESDSEEYQDVQYEYLYVGCIDTVNTVSNASRMNGTRH